VKILQNTLLSGAYIDVTDYKTSEGDGKLAVIGNHLTQNGTIKVINSDDAYIAGNTLDSGQIQARVPVWIVGNEVVGLGGSSPVPPVEVLPGTGAVQVIGNRVTMNGYNAHEGIDVNASDALIAGNIIEVNHVAGGSNYQPVYGIRSSSTTYATVVNNIVYQGSIGTPVHATNNAGIEASGRILGNIVFNLTHDLSAIKGLGSVEIKNNLCFNNSTNCGTANGNIEAHPEFEPDLQLAPTSPAIDAGPENFAFADLDRTRNDIGAYGGPWSIGQYDAQRDPLNYAPYVFPLFKAQASFSDGSLEVRALGVARLR
jgi:hypothetical protein